MRPNSRGNLGSSSGLPPGTGIRPGSGRKPPSTARLRTGVTSYGPGTMAAQGMAINASVNVSERPVTGQGVKGMKAVGQTGRIVYDAAYYIGLLRKRINDINGEIIKLRNEIDQQSRDNTQYIQLEKRYENLIKNKEQLEGQLADYNLALDKIRSSTDPDDVYQMAMHMADKNRQSGQDLDRIFAQRKQRESEILHIEEQIETQYRTIQRRINELEPGKLRAYNELIARQKDLQEKFIFSENKLNDLNSQIKHYEVDDKGTNLRKEFLNLTKKSQSLSKDLDSLRDELEIANLEPQEAHKSYVKKINDAKSKTKELEERAAQLRDEISVARRNLDEMDNVIEEDSEEIKKYDLLVKRDQDMTAFIETFDETKAGILQEKQQMQYMIVALLEHISKGIDDSSNLPTQETHQEMNDAKTFKEKNLATAQKTMETLVAEKKKRERELEMLRSSEPKLMNELSNLRDAIGKMRSEMEDFQDLDRIRREFDSTQKYLLELKQGYIKRRDTMKQQLQSVSAEYESLKKSINANEYAKEIDETEKRLKHYERTIFELKDFVDTKSRETDYEVVRMSCLKLVDSLNAQAIKESQGSSVFGAQAKSGW